MKEIKEKNFPFPYEYVKEREDAVDKAIKFIQECPYKGTGIKIELEALFGRDNSSRQCANCSNGLVRCSECGGDTDCVICKGRGLVDCTECDGTGRHHFRNPNLMENACHQYILEHLSDAAKAALVFSYTYRDGTVDTEFTFTLKLEDVRHAVEIIKVFASLGDHIGNGYKVEGAGMHISILNSDNCNYPPGNHLNTREAENFRYTVGRLMPALFFLGSSNYRSRHLNYRHPGVSMGNKYCAITGYSGCFEYRLFETCYERPEAILDNLCVIANTLKYYRYRKVKLPFFGKIGKVGFLDLGQGVERFYKVENAYKALMEGVKVLKPSYKTMADLRRERNFRITLTSIRRKQLIKERLWRKEYEITKPTVKLDKFIKDKKEIEITRGDAVMEI